MYKRLTVKDLKDAIKDLPDSTLVCLYSDSEGNQKSTALDYYIEIVGRKESFEYDGTVIEFTCGDDVEGIDLEADKNKYMLLLQPSL